MNRFVGSAGWLLTGILVVVLFVTGMRLRAVTEQLETARAASVNTRVGNWVAPRRLALLTPGIEWGLDSFDVLVARLNERRAAWRKAPHPTPTGRVLRDRALGLTADHEP